MILSLCCAVVHAAMLCSYLYISYMQVAGSPCSMIVSPSLHSKSSVLGHRVHKRINSISLGIIQLHPRAILQRQAVLLGLVQATPAPPPTPQLDLALLPGPLDPKANVDSAVDLVDLAAHPGVLARKVDFVAELLAHGGVGAQGVERRGDDAGLGFLVVEEGEERDCHCDDEEGQRLGDLGWDERGDTAIWSC